MEIIIISCVCEIHIPLRANKSIKGKKVEGKNLKASHEYRPDI